MHGPKSLIQNSFKLFTLSLNDLFWCKCYGKIPEELMQKTNKVYAIKSNSQNNSNLTFKTLNSPEFGFNHNNVQNFYPWIIKYSMLKKLDPDNPRYLTKITYTL